MLPEDHDGHHRNPEVEFGDIFRFYDAPSRAAIVTLRALTRAIKGQAPKRRRATIRLRRIVAIKRRAILKHTS